MSKYKPHDHLIGRFGVNDGSIDFYLRVNSLINSEAIVVDLGAGRASWFEDDDNLTRKNLRLLKGKVARVIAADIDPVVLDNRASDFQTVMKNGKLDIDSASVDLIVADYVLEHVDDPSAFFLEIDRVLKVGGWFCARTPHKFSYVALFSSLIKNSLHGKVLKAVQPTRKEMDVFPVCYKINTMADVRRAFKDWENRSFVYRTDPAYFFGKKWLYQILSFAHRVLFREFSGNIFVFVKKVKS